MVKLIVSILLVIFIVVFALRNMTVVPLYLVAVGPLNVPLIVVIAMSLFIGYCVAIFGIFMRTTKNHIRRKARNNPSGYQVPFSFSHPVNAK